MDFSELTANTLKALYEGVDIIALEVEEYKNTLDCIVKTLGPLTAPSSLSINHPGTFRFCGVEFVRQNYELGI